MTYLYLTFLVVFLLWLGKQLWCSTFGVPTFWCEAYDVDFHYSSVPPHVSDTPPDSGTSSGE